MRALLSVKNWVQTLAHDASQGALGMLGCSGVGNPASVIGGTLFSIVSLGPRQFSCAGRYCFERISHCLLFLIFPHDQVSPSIERW